MTVRLVAVFFSAGCIFAAENCLATPWDFPESLLPASEVGRAHSRANLAKGGSLATRVHAWRLFAELVKFVGPDCPEPRWRTWIDKDTALAPAHPGSTLAGGLLRGRRPAQVSAGVSAFNQVSQVAFNRVAAEHVQSLTKERLDSWRAEGMKEIPDQFPNGSAAIKTIWRRVRKAGTLDLAMWKYRGIPKRVADAESNGVYREGAWERCVAVNHEDIVVPIPHCYITRNGEVIKNVKLVDPLKEFYSVSVTSDNVKYFDTDPPAEVGDRVILVGLHLAVKEHDRWLWSTFWWKLREWRWRKNPPPKGLLDYDHNKDPWTRVWSHFDMEASLNLTGMPPPATPPLYNPYLEAQMPLGVSSRCDRCHDTMTFGNIIATDHVLSLPRARSLEGP